jgi:L-ascorbate metabolism protein UlaG (beta-lactamase superfamily)
MQFEHEVPLTLNLSQGEGFFRILALGFRHFVLICPTKKGAFKLLSFVARREKFDILSCPFSTKKRTVGILKNKQRKFSRRRFLAAGSLSAVGVWISSSHQLGARVVRGVVAETGRKMLKPEFSPRPETWNSNGITAAWLGHSTVLMNFYGVTILTDPVLFKRVGADALLGTIGPKRLIAPALHPAQLPQIDLVLLSHAHMDHLDLLTLRALPGHPRSVTAHDTTDLLIETKLKKSKSLKWGERTRVATARGDVEVSAFEVKHWGARWKVDRYRGYNGYVIEREGKKIIFGGDTAMTQSFGNLRANGPFEMAIMPIGAYQPWVCSHCTPEQAVQMTNAAGANKFLPIHFKTFPFGREGVVEPMERLEGAIEKERIALRDVGETCVVC